MTREEFFKICKDIYNTTPDYPFDEDFETAVMRHKDSRKWFCICMRVPRKKLFGNSEELIDVVNVKLPLEMSGSFCASDGVYPAYHMNKLHWISVLLPDADEDTVAFLTNVSFEATKSRKRKKITKE